MIREVTMVSAYLLGIAEMTVAPGDTDLGRDAAAAASVGSTTSGVGELAACSIPFSSSCAFSSAGCAATGSLAGPHWWLGMYPALCLDE